MTLQNSSFSPSPFLSLSRGILDYRGCRSWIKENNQTGDGFSHLQTQWWITKSQVLSLETYSHNSEPAGQQDVVLITKDNSQHMEVFFMTCLSHTLTQNELRHYWQKQKVDQQKCHVNNLWKDRVSPLQGCGQVRSHGQVTSHGDEHRDDWLFMSGYLVPTIAVRRLLDHAENTLVPHFLIIICIF